MPFYRSNDVDRDQQQFNFRESLEGLDESVDMIDDEEMGNSSIANMNELLESAIVEHVSMMNDQERKAYLNSDEFHQLEEAGVVGRRSVVRMTKYDDLTRRTHLAALQKAKEMGDADWEALRKNRIKERQLLDRIYKKYANKVKRDAVKSQKRLIKLSPRAFDMNIRNLR